MRNHPRRSQVVASYSLSNNRTNPLYLDWYTFPMASRGGSLVETPSERPDIVLYVSYFRSFLVHYFMSPLLMVSKCCRAHSIFGPDLYHRELFGLLLSLYHLSLNHCIHFCFPVSFFFHLIVCSTFQLFLLNFCFFSQVPQPL